MMRIGLGTGEIAEPLQESKAITENHYPIGMADYHLERLSEENAKRWEEFNAASPDGSLFHSLRWKRIAEQRTRAPRHYFLLFRNDAVVGLFPFFENTIYGFRGLGPASYPMSLHAILKDNRDPSAVQYVIEELRDPERGRRKISFICPATLHAEIFDTITTHPLFPYPPSGSPYEGEGDMVLDLARSPPDEIWNTFTARSGQRKKIRRFEKAGFEVTDVRSEDELQIFYRYYRENMKYIGGDLPPFSFFADLRDTLADEVRITLLSKGPLVAGGMLTILDRPRRRVHAVYLSLNRDLPSRYSPSCCIYWEAINWAWEHHYEKFTFGREYSNDLHDSNPRYRMKRDFGAEFEPVYSRMIPLTRIFTLGVRFGNFQAQRRAERSPARTAS
jgi:CelD/BcsL family acetyltransferase involved in cellulose biosynthesis